MRKKFFNDERIEYCDSLQQTVEGTDAVVLMTRWDEFAKLPEVLKEIVPQPIVIDGRRMLEKSRIEYLFRHRSGLASMKFTETGLDGAFVIEIEPRLDERGFFARGLVSQGVRSGWDPHQFRAGQYCIQQE